MRYVLPVLIGLFALAGCRGGGTQSDPAAATPASTEGSAPAAAAAAATEGSAVQRGPRAFELVTPETVAERIVEGIRAFDGPTIESGLFELGRNLSVWRSDMPPVLADALRDFASSPYVTLRRRVDARFIPPVAEALLSMRDYAAVLRLTHEYRDSVAEPSLAGPRTLAEQEARRSLAQIASVGCTALLDGHTIGATETLAAPGSYVLRCSTTGATVSIVAAPATLTRVDWNAGGRVEQTAANVATGEGSGGQQYRLTATIQVDAPILLGTPPAAGEGSGR